MKKVIKKVLIANRGEIAVRIIRTCKEMGIRTVAVYSQPDIDELHVNLADEAICIGPAGAADSYLNINNIIQAACGSGCDAIHPGFGFLSENPDFAEFAQACGLIFIGPSPKYIRLLGDKEAARAYMDSIGVAIVPGSKKSIDSLEDAILESENIGFPLLIKATAGGGGKGMRLVEAVDKLEDSFNLAKSEAKACFGDERVYMEKFIDSPKHIEVQLVCDSKGNVVHLFERDCSLQRNKQKIIEEAPCHFLNEATRAALIKTATKACKDIGYDSVGTMEFLVDRDGNFFFMEMNTRIQVEHPVSEAVTGVDIIKEQIRAASGLELSIRQKDIRRIFHAIECRIIAEDTENNFMPSPGKINFLNVPGGNGIRIDTMVYSGYTVKPFYDSMIMKLIAFAPTRRECIKKMRIALEQLIMTGIKTNIEFNYLLMHNKKFVSGRYTTKTVEEFIGELNENRDHI